jgi:hypothetical protein
LLTAQSAGLILNRCCEAFAPLQNIGLFRTIHNGGYFVEWDNDADLSADTLYLEGKPLR